MSIFNYDSRSLRQANTRAKDTSGPLQGETRSKKIRSSKRRFFGWIRWNCCFDWGWWLLVGSGPKIFKGYCHWWVQSVIISITQPVCFRSHKNLYLLCIECEKSQLGITGHVVRQQWDWPYAFAQDQLWYCQWNSEQCCTWRLEIRSWKIGSYT